MKHKKGHTWTEDKAYQRKLKEEEEKLDTLGQESEKSAVKPVQEEVKRIEQEEKEEEARKLETLTQLRKRKADAYKEALQHTLHDMVLGIGMEKEWQWGVWFDGKGIMMVVVDPQKERHVRAFFLTYEPQYDLHAAMVVARWVEQVYGTYQRALFIKQENEAIWTPPKKAKKNH